LWLSWDLAARAWARAPDLPPRASLSLPRGGLAAHADFANLRLRAGSRHFEKAPRRRPDRPFEPPPWSFAIEGERLVLYAPSGSPLPDPLTFSVALEQGESVDGAWTLASGNVVGVGWPLWPGLTAELYCDVPPESMLRVLVKSARVPGGNEPGAFRVLWDGEPLFERVTEAGDETGTWVEVALPPRGGKGVRLGMVLEGARGMGAAFEPILGPRELAGPLRRPLGSRPDVVLFVADTFRADNLSAYGGEGLTPHLDRFVERSLRFRDCRSTATWTLPALASLFSASYPTQHGAVGPQRALAQGFRTLAEHLRAFGYRTVGVTDSFFASRRYGLAQGFSWFREIPTDAWSFEKTLEEAERAIDRDDGRPLFLFVHTYRTHKPYRVGAAEQRSAFDELVARVEEEAGGSRPTAALSRAYRAHASGFAELYAEGVRDLDRRLGAWLSRQEERGLFREGLCILTSDHGESFDEHGDMFHRLPPWEEQIRVPLILHGGRIEAREALGNASLIDVPRTIAQYCGVPEPPDWGGRALLSEGAGEIAFAFRMGPDAGRYSELGVVEGRRKIFLMLDTEDPSQSELRFAFDLESDPKEENDLAGQDWARTRSEDLLPTLMKLTRRRFEPGEVTVGAREQAGLEELGYAGDENP